MREKRGGKRKEERERQREKETEESWVTCSQRLNPGGGQLAGLSALMTGLCAKLKGRPQRIQNKQRKK